MATWLQGGQCLIPIFRNYVYAFCLEEERKAILRNKQDDGLSLA